MPDHSFAAIPANLALASREIGASRQVELAQLCSPAFPAQLAQARRSVQGVRNSIARRCRRAMHLGFRVRQFHLLAGD